MLLNFGVGNLIALPTGVTTPTPTRFGVLQDVDLECSFDEKKLYGQYQFPVDVARGQANWSIKAKSAGIFANAMNSLFFGQTITTGTGRQTAIDEAHSVPAVSTYTVTTTHSATFLSDGGVFYGAGSANAGAQFQLVTSLTAAGQYTFAAGVYTFYSADASAPVLISYDYSVTTMTEISLSNLLMGASPTFAIDLQESYTNNGGVAQTMNLHLNACKLMKMSFPFKNSDYMISDLDISVFADSSNNVGLLTINPQTTGNL